MYLSTERNKTLCLPTVPCSVGSSELWVVTISRGAEDTRTVWEAEWGPDPDVPAAVSGTTQYCPWLPFALLWHEGGQCADCTEPVHGLQALGCPQWVAGVALLQGAPEYRTQKHNAGPAARRPVSFTQFLPSS
jgi:hypothetical protein